MTRPQFEKDRYLVLKRDRAEKILSPGSLQELDRAIQEIGHTYFVVNLDEEEGRASMEAYFSERYPEKPDRCPECGSILAHQGGCVECPNPACGWATCA